ncbi:MAG: CGNR zinc finger domain-containing protein [Candidatus Eremiobacteraeota bacterium]|nr:CGNR zinc finger domain-containing protein [Candidatus Eremiobacteraeota bacterium]MBV8204075.1 CGNR zinc finger domain-containing protein [Candidatus Eremiobacteraeota bacterium]MBV8264517.1 CGNR zinc finger domain-containing protein [Candidatus Eremiobacteraeota bacterium]MBV8338631.1 CGNR zinc finger domain-containing protein [Candidatus Eremiobacteraeota bacterium]MBV8459821.1 CGNR zinc finger domain-containing protein [Candidatus Eremiobacteraeota bacterium]
MDSSDESKPPEAAPRRELAPGELRLVQDFINAWDLWGVDRHSKPSTLEQWLSDHRLPGAENLTDADVRHAVAVREALRDLAAANDGASVSKEVADTLSRAARSAHLGVQFDHSGHAALEPHASGLDAALGVILAVVARSMLDGSWARLKVCRDDTCRWAFYDRSKNRSSCWCLMSVCGNRSKVRRHRQQRSRTTKKV